MSGNRTPAQLYATVFGAVLLVAGIAGFFYESSFDGDARDAVFGILDVNGVHNIIHIASGLVGLAVMGSAANSRTYALVFGVVYVIVAAWGFAVGDGEAILDIVPVNTEDNILHLVIGLVGLGAWQVSGGRTVATPTSP